MYVFIPGRFFTMRAMTLKTFHSVTTLLCNTRKNYLSFGSVCTCASVLACKFSTGPLPNCRLWSCVYWSNTKLWLPTIACNDFCGSHSLSSDSLFVYSAMGYGCFKWDTLQSIVLNLQNKAGVINLSYCICACVNSPSCQM